MNARFIDGPSGRLFCLARDSGTTANGGPAALVIPPFGEEQNKSRALISDMSRALCALGISTIQFDLSGTGDSDGEFSDATWEGWKQDVHAVIEWATNNGYRIRKMLAVRTGASLCADALATADISIEDLIFIQPTVNLPLFLKQFIRLRVAASMVSGNQPETVKEILERSTGGATIDVAGYGLNPALVGELRSAKFNMNLKSKADRLLWFEVSRSGGEEKIASASQAVVTDLSRSGLRVTTGAIGGDPFWMSTEIVRNEQLVAHIVKALEAS